MSGLLFIKGKLLPAESRGQSLPGCVLLTKEQLTTYELMQLINALSSYVSAMLLTLAEDCGECKDEYKDVPPDELIQEFDRPSVGIGNGGKAGRDRAQPLQFKIRVDSPIDLR